MIDLKIFAERLKHLRREKELSQKELGEKIGKTEESAQAYISKLENQKLKPDLDTLYNLANLFGVSIDWLIGKTESTAINEKITPRGFCRMLSSLRNSYVNISYSPIQRKERCIDGQDVYNPDPHYYEKTNIYTAIFFSSRLKADDPGDDDLFYQLGNYSSKNASIDLFLSRLQKIDTMLLSGDLDPEMYDILLQSYLKDVPDK